MNQASTDPWNQLLGDTFTTLTGDRPEADTEGRLSLIALGGRLLGIGQVASIRSSWLEGRDDNGLMTELPEDVTLIRLGWQVDILAAIARSCRTVAWEATTGETGMIVDGHGTNIDELSKLALDTYAQQLPIYRSQHDRPEPELLCPPFVTALLIGEDDALTAYTDGLSLEIRRIKAQSSMWAVAEKAVADLHLEFWDHPGTTQQQVDGATRTTGPRNRHRSCSR